MTERALMVWENEDGEGWVEVADEPDRDRAGQYVADAWGLVAIFTGRGTIKTQDCECLPTTDHCVDRAVAGDPGPCVVRDAVDCWGFEGTDYPKDATPDAIRGEVAYWPKGTQPDWAKPVDQPKPLPVAPGQIEAFR